MRIICCLLFECYDVLQKDEYQQKRLIGKKGLLFQLTVRVYWLTVRVECDCLAVGLLLLIKCWLVPLLLQQELLLLLAIGQVECGSASVVCTLIKLKLIVFFVQTTIWDIHMLIVCDNPLLQGQRVLLLLCCWNQTVHWLVVIHLLRVQHSRRVLRFSWCKRVHVVELLSIWTYVSHLGRECHLIWCSLHFSTCKWSVILLMNYFLRTLVLRFPTQLLLRLLVFTLRLLFCHCNDQRVLLLLKLSDFVKFWFWIIRLNNAILTCFRESLGLVLSIFI